MNFQFLSPRHQLVETITRIYHQGMTTTSGGNLSIYDDEGNIWITPGGIDKGALVPDDIVCIRPDGTIEGRHKPSSEYPFHRMIYQSRMDVRAIVHAHPPGLVAFSIVRKKPNTRINAPFRDICGRVGYSPYALPGSEDLGKQIANTFAQGFNSVLLENHGVVTAGGDLLQAFQRFETLEYCAQINIRARAFGEYRTLSNEQIDLFYLPDNYLPEFQPERHTSRERELRLQICQFVQRAYERRLMISTSGTVSARVDSQSFLVTPSGYDRKYITSEGLVLIHEGQREAGKVPSRSVKMHDLIYRAHPDVNSIMTALPPNITTYGAITRPFDTRTIPESYILLRDMPVLPYGLQYQQPEQVAAAISRSTPVILLQNDAVVTTGTTILEAFDRIEVAEFSAQSLLQSLNLGELVPISDDEIGNLKQRFSLK